MSAFASLDTICDHTWKSINLVSNFVIKDLGQVEQRYVRKLCRP